MEIPWLTKLSGYFYQMASFFSDFFNNLFTTTIGDVVSVDNDNLVGVIISWVTPEYIENMSIGVFILGAGLSAYIAYQLFTWLFNIFT